MFSSQFRTRGHDRLAQSSAMHFNFLNLPHETGYFS